MCSGNKMHRSSCKTNRKVSSVDGCCRYPLTPKRTLSLTEESFRRNSITTTTTFQFTKGRGVSRDALLLVSPFVWRQNAIFRLLIKMPHIPDCNEVIVEWMVQFMEPNKMTYGRETPTNEDKWYSARFALNSHCSLQ